MKSAQLRLTGVRLRAKARPWGGRREGAGRPRKDGVKGARPGVAHVKRAELKARFPVHVTWRINRAVPSLRTGRMVRELAKVVWLGANGAFQVVHYSFQRDHVHLLVEAEDRVALSRGMQGLGVRMARAINRLVGRKGNVVPDRYHATILQCPTMVVHARNYLLQNARKHYGRVEADPFASRVPVRAPRTWMLRQQP